MILADQPTIFGDDVIVRLSSVDDGNMRDLDTLTPETRANFERFVRS